MANPTEPGAPWFAMPAEPDADERGEWLAPVERLAVIGGGQMGSGIAEVAVRAGVEVVLLEADEQAAARAREGLTQRLERAVRGGRLDRVEADDALRRALFTAEWALLDGAEAAIEAIVEDPAAKREVFARLDKALPDAVFLASNTSSVPIMKLASATARPERVLGLHFFNPVAAMDLVEVVPSLRTDPYAVVMAERFVSTTLGKTTIRAPDRAGFVVNALLVPFLLCAIRMLEAGPASSEEIDRGMVNGCRHPMGPLALADLIGLDTVLAVSESLYEEFHDPFYSAPPLLRRKVEAGQLGRKTGQGFYPHDLAGRPVARAAA
jgi:3-hydroxybutyryl-CoA dehydrogenase